MTDPLEPVIPVRPTPGLGRDIARSSVWSLGGQVAVLAASFLATPFTVRLLGPAGYGLLALVVALIGYVSVLDLGMGTASTRFASTAFAGGDDRDEAAVVWTASVITLVPSAAVAVAIWLAAPALVRHFLDLTPSLRGSGVLALKLGSLALLGRIIANVVNTPELVRLRWDLYVLISNGTSIGQVVAVPIVLAAGGGVGAAVGVSAVAAGLAVGLHLWFGSRLQPALLRPSVRPALVRPLLAFGGALLAANLIAVVVGNAERFILAATQPIQAVGYYSVAANLSAIIAVLPIAICQPLLPAFARLDGPADAPQSSVLYRRAMTSILAGVLPMAVGLAVIARPFLDVWAGTAYGASSTGPLRVLVLGVVVNACAFVPYNYLVGTGAARVILRCHLLELVIYPFYAIPLVLEFGTIGAAVVWTLRLVFVTVFLLVVAARRGGASTAPFGQVARRLGPAACLLIVPLVAALVLASPVIPMALLAVALPLYARLAWRQALDEVDRTQIRRLLRIPGRSARA